MIERDKRNQRKTEEILEELRKILQPVLAGDRKGIDILTENTNPFEGKTAVYFFPVSGILGERGKQVFERLKEEYGFMKLGFGDESPRKIDTYESEKVWRFLTEKPGVVFTRQEVFDNKRGFKSPIRTTWSIENLSPKTRKDRAREKVQDLTRRVRQRFKIYQYYQG